MQPIVKSGPEAIPLTTRPTTGEAPEVVPEVLNPIRRNPVPKFETHLPCPNCDSEKYLYGYGCSDCGWLDSR
jgi:hypothetical protein